MAYIIRLMIQLILNWIVNMEINKKENVTKDNLKKIMKIESNYKQLYI